MKRVATKTVFEGAIATVRHDRFQYADGSQAVREIVGHPGAVAMVAHDGSDLWLVRQPREAVDEEALLEIPAGKLDVEGESPVETARRELREEIGMEPAEIRELKQIFVSPGLLAERITIYEASGLRPLPEGEWEPDPNERIEVVRRPIGEIDKVIERMTDAKSLIGLMLFRDAVRAG